MQVARNLCSHHRSHSLRLSQLSQWLQFTPAAFTRRFKVRSSFLFGLSVAVPVTSRPLGCFSRYVFNLSRRSAGTGIYRSSLSFILKSNSGFDRTLSEIGRASCRERG